MAISEKAEEILTRAGALRTGHFLLSSGLHSDRYCQCATLFESPAMGGEVAHLMATIIPRDLSPDVVLTPAIGGMLVGYELARALGVRSLFAERKPGEPFALRRGFALNPGERVLLVEDVITTGKSVLELRPLVESAGAKVVGFASIADRSRGAFRQSEPLFALTELSFPTYQPNACTLCAAGLPIDKPGSREVAAKS